MDIYSFIRSKDVAEHCRNIGKTWNTCEMAVIIDRSDRTLSEKHAAWQELIDNYPDMPNIPSYHKIRFESTHKRLAEMINYEQRLLERFKNPEPGMYYRYIVRYDDGSNDYHSRVFTTFGKALSSIHDEHERKDTPKITFEKIPLDGADDYERHIGVTTDFDGNTHNIFTNANKTIHAEWFPDVDYSTMLDFDFESLFFIDIPIPFKRGDLLTCGRYNSEVFVLDSTPTDNPERYAKRLRGELSDGSDMICWGFYVDESAALFGDHTEPYDCFEYYSGKLQGKERLLHYVSLFIKGEIGLSELLNIQCRLLVGNMLSENFHIRSHGCYIPDVLLAENRKNT